MICFLRHHAHPLLTLQFAILYHAVNGAFTDIQFPGYQQNIFIILVEVMLYDLAFKFLQEVSRFSKSLMLVEEFSVICSGRMFSSSLITTASSMMDFNSRTLPGNG